MELFDALPELKHSNMLMKFADYVFTISSAVLKVRIIAIDVKGYLL